ncbi:MAG: FAD-dependent oxidoreductase [Candidatus Omnitrophica bacterium]|nr:FAD-dependent oxidoreductase [Candidatus Omnitrophota bacterium]
MDYDICIIGAGWAGFNAAMRAKELGLSVCLVEQSAVGGTCLNRGCIPTKVMVNSAKLFAQIKKFPGFGIDLSAAKINFEKIQIRKNAIIEKLNNGMQFQLKTKGIDFITGRARLINSDEISVDSKNIKTKHIIIATGSKPLELPF